jgi:hypothetical protein
MGKSLLSEVIYPSYVALSPKQILKRHAEIIQVYGLDNVVKGKDFQRAREVYQTAIYALGVTAQTGILYWVLPSKENTPDSYLVSLEGKNLFVECVELTLWNEHVESLWQIIENKISKKYPSNFSIVIHLSPNLENINSAYFQNIYDRLKSFSISAGTVRFWMEIKNKGDKDLLWGELYPNNSWTEFSSEEVLAKYILNPEIFSMKLEPGQRRAFFNKNDIVDVVLPTLLKSNKRD